MMVAESLEFRFDMEDDDEEVENFKRGVDKFVDGASCQCGGDFGGWADGRMDGRMD